MEMRNDLREMDEGGSDPDSRQPDDANAARAPGAPARKAEVARLNPHDGYPVLRTLARSPALVDSKPFHGTCLALLLHPRRSLKATLATLCALGADPPDITLLYKDYRYPERKEVLEWATTAGVRTAPLSDLKVQVAAFEARLNGRRWLALEDGGHWAMEAYRRPLLLSSAIGFVEQTTRGIWTVERSGVQLIKPHLSLPASVIKKTFECDFVGEAVTLSLKSHMGGALAGATVAVLGAAGTIGAAVAESLRQAGMRVYAYDSSPPPYWALTKHGRITVCASKAEAITGRDVVVGATGGTVLELDDLRWLKDGVLLASASSEQVEFPLALLRQFCPCPLPWSTSGVGATNGEVFTLPAGRRIVLLDGGRPINLGMAGSPEAECFDLIMALLAAGAADMAGGFYADSAGIIDDFDQVCERHNLDGLYRALHPEVNQ